MNRQIRRLAIGLLVCYLALFVQLNVLQVGRASELNADPRNTRQELRDFNRPRGQIITADGLVVARSDRLIGAEDFEYQRVYPLGELMANVSGYFTYGYGSTQIERTQNEVLAGRTTQQIIRALPSLLNRSADPSGSVVLTMRADLQSAAREALGEREGSVVLLDPGTGAVLAMWSWPTYDPNLVVQPDFEEAGAVLEFLNALPGKPTLANAYQERYMPGSAFKLVTATAALQSGQYSLDSSWPVETEWTPPFTDDPIQNYGGTACGGTFSDVFRRSCNIPFAQMAVELGAPTMVQAANAFGFGEPVPIDLPRPAASLFGEISDFDEAIPLLAIQGFGQGSDAVVPLHMALITSAVANDGRMMKPYVVDRTLDHAGRVLTRTRPSVWKTPMTAETADTLGDLMVLVVNNGTARCCMQLAGGEQAAAKTGTAQLNEPGEPERSHAWITAFAPAEDPRFAIAVVLKGTNEEISAGTGGSLAGPVAKEVLDAAFAALPADG